VNIAINWLFEVPEHNVGRNMFVEEIYRRIYAKYRDFTMIPETTYIRNLRIADRVRHLNGPVVECGVWRGGMIAGIAELLGPDRRYVLFDSFQGLPPAQEIDGTHALAWQADVNSPGYYDNCSAPMETAHASMQMSGAKDFTIVKGWFDETIRQFTTKDPIALLRLDGDWYDSTLVSLNYLYPQVDAEGLIIVDDYYAWDGCAHALHEFLAHISSTRRIQQFDNEICVLTPHRFWFYP
jgi:O-methyltransferase